MGHLLSKELVEAAQKGDMKAWRALIEATQSRLYRFCLVLCGDPVRAEDLCQDAYLKTFDQLAKVTKPESFIDWLFRMTKNLYIDSYRRTRETPIEIADDRIASTGELSEHLAVHQVLSQFEPPDRLLLILVDMEEYSYAEAAGLMGISEDAVRSRLFRLRQEFSKKWQNLETK
jgi:RNA polymerase sigma-70 factor (ECF subfamily)